MPVGGLREMVLVELVVDPVALVVEGAVRVMLTPKVLRNLSGASADSEW